MNEQSKLTEFDYLLNRMENAARTGKPAEHGYGEHRKALFAHVRDLEARAALAAQPVAWAICMRGGRGVQRLYYAKPTADDLLYWDRDAGWNDLAPHVIVPLYAAPPAAREGWQWVPVEPTQEMCQQGQWKAQEWPRFPLRIVPIWKAMLRSAPPEQP